MTKLPDHAEQLALAAVKQFAPTELPLFPLLWEEVSDDPDAEVDVAIGSHQKHGGGAHAVVTVLSPILVHAAIYVSRSFAKKAADELVDEVVSYLKAKLKAKASDGQSQAIAKFLVEESTNQGKEDTDPSQK